MSDEMSHFAKTILEEKYSHIKKDGTKETWDNIAYRVTKHVMKSVNASKELTKDIEQIIKERKFIPGGRYLYSSGRPYHQTQNCLLLRAEDSREGWADLCHKSTQALMTGAGIGIDYSDIRAEGKPIRKTGGFATGPIALMQMINELGRGIMQGGSRRCLPFWTPVTMANGSRKQIDDIKVGDLVQTRLGPKKVLNVFDQGEQELIRIDTEHGFVLATENHKWLAADRTRRKTWMTTGDLSLNNKLYYHPYQQYDENKQDMDLNLAYTIGYFIGDGCAYSCNRTHEVTFQIANKHYDQNQIDKIIKTMSNLGITTNPKIRKGHGECTEIRCRSKDLVTHFQQYKKPNQPPEVQFILSYKNEVINAFMAGWFDADGYLGEESWKLANTHETTRFMIERILNYLGIQTTQSGIEVRINSYQKAMFLKTIGKYMTKKHLGGIDKETSEIPSKILKIEKNQKIRTFDIEVEEVHEFFAFDFVSHNSAIWAGLNWSHSDIHKFITMKNWIPEVRSLKEKDFNFPANMDGTNISVLLDDEFFEAYNDDKNPKHSHAQSVYWATLKQMLKTGEPGFSIDTGINSGETLRNACTEVTSRDDSDICNLGSINLSRINDLSEMERVVNLASAFLLAGTIYSDVPYPEVDKVRTKNRRLGLGLMGIHEWLLKNGKQYGPDSELDKYLEVYAQSGKLANKWAKEWELTKPVKTRAVAPTGTIAIIGETTTGIEPIFCAAYKRRYKKGLIETDYQYVLDPTAKRLVDKGTNPDLIEDAYSIDFERRLQFQAHLQKYVDHAISSTINLPEWGSEANNDTKVQHYGNILIKYLPQLRGITAYPDGARSGQPLTPVSYREASEQIGQVFVEQADSCDISKGGACGT